MTWPPGVWLCLLAGVMLVSLPIRSRAPWPTALGMVLVFAGLLSPVVIAPADGVDSWDRIGWLTAVAWWIGFGWTPHYRPERCEWSPVRCGWTAIAAAGMWLVAIADDFVVWVLAVELVRQATTPARLQRDPSNNTTREFDWEQWCPVILALAVAGWIAVTGNTSFQAIGETLQRTHGTSDAGDLLGRPALALVGAAALTILALAAPVLWTARSISADDWSTSFPVRLAALTARQFTTVLALLRLFATGATGLETAITVVVLLVTAVAWCLAIRWLHDPQRFDRRLFGAALFQWGAMLLGTLAGLGHTQLSGSTGELLGSLDPTFGLTGGLPHGVLVFAAMASAATLLCLVSDGPLYLDQLRGLGMLRPMTAASLWLPLASLVGLPLLAGFWFRLAWLLGLLGLHQLGGDEELVPHLGMRIAAVAGVLTLAVVSSAFLQVARLMVLEPPIGVAHPRRQTWPLLVAFATAVVLVIGGWLPQVLN